MVVALITFIILAVIICKVAVDAYYLKSERISIIIVACLIWIVSTCLILFINSAFAPYVFELEYSKTDDFEIVALKDNNSVIGSFYIVGGYVDENLYYYYAYDTEFGYKTDKISADNSYIKTSETHPRIETYNSTYKNKYVKLIATDWLCPHQYIIYCPENTITTEFKVDLE